MSPPSKRRFARHTRGLKKKLLCKSPLTGDDVIFLWNFCVVARLIDYGCMRSRTGAVDTLGLDWSPITDRDVLRCTNLELLTKVIRLSVPLARVHHHLRTHRRRKRKERVKRCINDAILQWKFHRLALKPREKQLWDELDCEAKLDESHIARLVYHHLASLAHPLCSLQPRRLVSWPKAPHSCLRPSFSGPSFFAQQKILTQQSRAGRDCARMLSKFSIVPGKSWGSADDESKVQWDGQRCNPP